MIIPNANFRPNPKRAIYIHGPIDENLLYELTPQIVTLQSEPSPITIYINSPGGNIGVAESIWRLLNVLNQDFTPACQIITVATLKAASAAADLLSSGNYAIAFPQSTILYHGVRTFRDIPLTVETTSAIAQFLRATNDTYAMELMRKNESRFMFRFLLSRDQFDSIRQKYTGKKMTDADCFLSIISDHLSEHAQKLFNTAKERKGRYDNLLNIAKKSSKNRNVAKIEASRIKAMVDFEVDNNKKDASWTFQSGGLSRLIDDFFILNEHLESMKSDRLNRLCSQWGYFSLDPTEIKNTPEELKKDRLVKIVRPKLEPLWSFFVALCHTLQEGENDLTATDAYWLGLIDEVMGVKDLRTIRQIAEYKDDTVPAVTPTTN